MTLVTSALRNLNGQHVYLGCKNKPIKKLPDTGIYLLFKQKDLAAVSLVRRPALPQYLQCLDRVPSILDLLGDLKGPSRYQIPGCLDRADCDQGLHFLQLLLLSTQINLSFPGMRKSALCIGAATLRRRTTSSILMILLYPPPHIT